MSTQTFVSIHGGHSGEFCNHATDTLEGIVQEYIRKGFSWVGITEHIPPPRDECIDMYDKEVGHDAAFLYERFARYIEHARSLQAKYTDDIDILVGCEGEAYIGFEAHTKKLLKTFSPDYFIGSVHQIGDRFFDGSKEEYNEIAESVGGLVPMYCEYFDTQHLLIESLRPPVIGHFDYIRLFDDQYTETLRHPEVEKRIERNLQAIQKYNLLMEINVSSLYEGISDEPYSTRWILELAYELDIQTVPGDDSHGIETVGASVESGIQVLKEIGFDTSFPLPHFS